MTALAEPLTDQRGIALAMALIALLILMTLSITFANLTKTEPVIGSNHLRTAQARSLAESGIERAVWALTGAGLGGVDLASVPGAGVTAPAPYNGATLLTANTGGFLVTIVGAASNQALVTAEGWTPTNDPNDPQTKAHQRVTVSLMHLRNLAVNAPCALCVNGSLELSGSSLVDSRADTNCGSKYGAASKGDLLIDGNAKVFGAKDGDSVPNEYNPATPATNDYVKNDTSGLVDYSSFKLTPDDMDALKDLAKAQGTYYGPGHPAPGTSSWTGTVAFGSSNPLTNGIVFVDTIDGSNTITASNGATVTVNVADGFKGWLVVNGSVRVDGNVWIQGLVYAQNDFVYRGTGTGKISGLVVSQNVLTSGSQLVDTDTLGNATIEFNCANAKNGGGQLPTGWFPRPGTYCEGPLGVCPRS